MFILKILKDIVRKTVNDKKIIYCKFAMNTHNFFFHQNFKLVKYCHINNSPNDYFLYGQVY